MPYTIFSAPTPGVGSGHRFARDLGFARSGIRAVPYGKSAPGGPGRRRCAVIPAELPGARWPSISSRAAGRQRGRIDYEFCMDTVNPLRRNRSMPQPLLLLLQSGKNCNSRPPLPLPLPAARLPGFSRAGLLYLIFWIFDLYSARSCFQILVAALLRRPVSFSRGHLSFCCVPLSFPRLLSSSFPLHPALGSRFICIAGRDKKNLAKNA